MILTFSETDLSDDEEVKDKKQPHVLLIRKFSDLLLLLARSAGGRRPDKNFPGRGVLLT